MRLFLFTSILALLISGCGGDGGSSQGPQQPGPPGNMKPDPNKPLFAQWTITTQDWWIDLSGGNTNGNPFKVSIYTKSGSKCSCTFEMIGTSSTGACKVSACKHTAGRDPGCTLFNGMGDTYKRKNGELELCDGCTTYR